MEILPQGAEQYLAKYKVDPEEFVRMGSLAKRFEEARIESGETTKGVAKELKVAQYRIKAIENGQVSEIEPRVLRKYSDYLGLNEWCSEWAEANEHMAEKLGITQWS